MTSFANLAQSLAASLPSTSAGPSGASGRSSTDHEEPFVMSHILNNLLENMTITSPLTSVATTPVPTTASSSSVTYDIWSVPPIPTPMQTPIGSSRESYNVTSNNNNQPPKEDNSSGSPGTSSSVASISCFRCEERSPTTRCLECNDLFCHECCHKPTSDCQLREHTLLPIHQISPIGARPSPNSINSGHMNSGSFNSGSHTSGSHNSGSLNSGSMNCGSLNSGSINCGSLNSGSHNSGSLHSASMNSSSLNSSSLNSGSLNSGTLNSGSFNCSSFNAASLNSSSLNSTALNSLNSLNALNMLNIDKNDMLTCDLHSEFARYYCESCVLFICHECSQWLHKDHNFTPIRGALDVCRIGVFKAIEETKTGTKAIKTAIDRAVAMSKAYEKETAEANMKIRKAMRCYAQAVEDREKYLLDKVEKMRQAKMTELTDHMNTLRGILAGLAHTNETLVRSMDSEGIDLFMAKEKGKASVDYFSCMFKSMYITEERIMFIPPNYDLVDQLKRQCDVQPAPAGMHSSLQSRQSLLSMQSIQSAQSFPPLNYTMPSTNSLRSMPEYTSGHTRSTNYYDHSISSSISMESNPSRGIGQAIPGYWMSVTVRPARSPVPGVPVFSFGREGQDEGQVSRPWGLCVDREGNIIVADRRNNRIQIFNCRGEFKTMFGSKGTGPGEFDLPAGITTDTYGRIIVIDKDNHRVQIFTSSGNFILKFGSFGKECGQFQYPWDVAVNTVGNIVVTDTRNHRIQMFTSDGSYITKFVFEGANPAKLLKGPTTPRGVCYTTSGNIIVSDFENHRLLMVDPTLSKVLHCVGREGSGIGELNRPSGIVTDDDGRIIVADSKNHRVLVFTSELRILWAVDLKSPGLDDKDRPSDVALTTDGYLVVLFETLPDTARDISSHGKQYIKVY